MEGDDEGQAAISGFSGAVQDPKRSGGASQCPSAGGMAGFRCIFAA